MADVGFDNVRKIYPDGTEAVRAFSLNIPDGSLAVFVGPSGCGKTTVLRMVAGLEEITEGTVTVGERIVNDLQPQERDCAMVFQNYALYPHMTVYNNMAFGLKLRKMAKREIDTRVRSAAAALGLTQLLEKRPRTLSGGQRQRVAMGRAIVREPKVFLMDEPLSNLDARLRVQMRTEISRIQRELGVTTIYVTHDQTEATTMGDMVVVMRDGVLQQVGAPKALFNRPRNLFVAGFIGSPGMNLTEAEIVSSEDGLVAQFAGHTLRISDRLLAERPLIRSYVGRRVALGIRPESFHDHGEPTEGDGISIVAELREELGAETLIHFAVNGKPVVTDTEDREGIGSLAGPSTTTFIARLPSQCLITEGRQANLRVDVDALHVFDLDSGDGIYDGAG